MKSHEAIVLVHSSTSYTPKFLHVSTDTKQKTQVNAKSSNISSSLAADPEHAKVSIIVELVEFAFVDRSDTKLTLDSRDQRRPLEESASQGLKSSLELSLTTGNLVMETNDADVLLSGTLLGLDQAGRTVNTDDQATGDLRVKSSTVTSFLCPQDSLHPSDNLVTRWIGRLVEVDHT
jgi:hypothetical protein